MKSPQRTQQLQGLGRLIESTGIPYTAQSLSYDPSGRGLFTGAGGLGGTTRMRPEALEAAMTVAPFVGPTARVGAQAAKVAAKELSPVAGDMLMNYMVKQRMILPLDVYHGTPHRLPPTDRNPLGEFDASKIGTGEGAQAYGYGIYTAEAPAVARGYADRLGSNIISVDGKPMDFNDPVHIAASIISDPNNAGLPGKQLANAIRYDPRGIVPYGAESKVEEIAKALESGNLPKFTNQKGNLYKADLPDEKIAKMLDWDKPLSQQHLDVQAGLKGIAAKFPKIPDFNLQKWMDTDPLASTFHNVLNRDLGADPAFIANLFKERGIPGIKYLDQNSRQPGTASMTQAQLDTRINILKKDIDSGLGDQERMKQILASMEQERALHTNLTRNFVVFPGEEKSMRILERNGETAASPFYQDPFMDTTR
jgi:hypothetical protein